MAHSICVDSRDAHFEKQNMQTEARALEIDALVQQNLSTRREVETWIAGQKEKILQDKQEHAFLAQEHARQTHEAQHSRDQLQLQHQQLASSMCPSVALTNH